MESPALTAILARFVVGTATETIPPHVISGARSALVDTLGVGLAGSREEASKIAARWLEDTAGSGPATVWGCATRVTAADAAFCNGIQAHTLDFDDSSLNLRGHPSATMIPSALAVGEATGASGLEVLAAYALGLEVASKLSPAVGPGHYFRGWHTTTTVGIFAVTAIAARLWRLSAGQLQHAWGLAASQAAGLKRNFGTMTKSYHAGHAARCGILAARLASWGFTADPAIFDGNDGFLATYGAADGKPLAEQMERLGKPWEIESPGIYVKRWPCCYAVHRPVAGLLELLAGQSINAEDIEAISIGFLPGVEQPLIHHDPHTGLEAKFSTEYAIAAAVLDRKLTLESFTDAMVKRPAIRHLMPRVRSFTLPGNEVHNGLTGYNEIVVETVHGRLEKRIDRTPGSPQWPLTEAEQAEKFLNCAGSVLAPSRAASLLALAQRCDQLADIGELLAATVP
jgi:2-methylcitrate dehydratase PrpD